MHLVLVNRSGGLNLPRNSVVRITARSDLTIAVVHIKQQINNNNDMFCKAEGLYQYVLHKHGSNIPFVYFDNLFA